MATTVPHATRPETPHALCPVPSVDGLFPRAHPSVETLVKLGAAALATGPIAGVPAILLGRLVLREIAGGDGRYTGEARARLGMGLGWAGTEAHVLLLLYAVGTLSEAFALVVLALGMAAGIAITIGLGVARAPGIFVTAAGVSRRAPRVVVPAVIGLVAVGLAGFVTKRRADERARMEAQAACAASLRAADEALGGERFVVARSHLREARWTCSGAGLAAIARAEADVDARERAARRQQAEEEAARAAAQKAEEERRRTEKEERAAEKLKSAAPTIARQLQMASGMAAQRRWEEADKVLRQAEIALEEIKGTQSALSEQGAGFLAQVDRLRPQVDAGMEQLRRARAEQEARREAMKEAAAERRRATLRLQCCDGTISPSCLCSRASHGGCCSHHRGVCGCEE